MPIKQKEKMLEGVVVKLSKVNKYVVGERCYILLCDCVKKGLYWDNRDVHDFSYVPGLDSQCPVCGYYTWHKTEEGLPRGGTFYPKNPTC